MELTRNAIADGGFQRLRRAQKKLSLESLEKDYAAELATATPAQKQRIYEEIFEKFARQKDHRPSAGSLW